jgi:hypothetical protein
MEVVKRTLAQQMELLLKGCVDVVRPEDLEARLAAAGREGRPLTVKVGFDPSAPISISATPWSSGRCATSSSSGTASCS